MKMNSHLILVLGLYVLFLISIPAFNFYLRPEQFSNYSLLKSLIITIVPIIYLTIRWSKSTSSMKTSIGFYTNLSTILTLLLASIVMISLFSLDYNELRITRGVARKESIWIRLLNLHIVLVLFVAIISYSYKEKNGKLRLAHKLLIALALSLSLYIAYLEGRRAAILIPIMLIGFFELKSTTNFKNFVYKVIIFSGVFLILFMLITNVRSGVVYDNFELIFRSILSRLFNPGHMMLEVFTQNNYDFNPDTINKIILRIGYIFGLNDYSGSTNDFGRYYGFLSSKNFTVGINPGIILESFLYFSYFYIFVLIFIFEFSFYLLNLYKKILFNSDVFVAVLLLHGFQMELPYTIGLMIKLLIAGYFAHLFQMILPKK